MVAGYKFKMYTFVYLILDTLCQQKYEKKIEIKISTNYKKCHYCV